ncbi:sulfatase [Thalassoglobus sp. JC818]|uniref:sulfatase family protein n=1 Tax=Thalassoglobus sp. JC818 TaxID=3232136 RepID=UPI00345A365A
MSARMNFAQRLQWPPTLAMVLSLVVTLFHQPVSAESSKEQLASSERPNILVFVSDDQSWCDAGAYGNRLIKTPNFDRIAREGVLFQHAFCSSPSCTPSRGTILTGMHHWQLEEGANLHSTLPAKFQCYPDVLEDAGYSVGFIGKGWGPGQHDVGGRPRNPAGPAFNKRRFKPDDVPAEGISNNHYAANFEDFLKQSDDKPFCCWVGTHEPHRSFEFRSGLIDGRKPEDVNVPEFLPDLTDVRIDLLDYYREIEWSDQQLGACLKILEEQGRLDNTLVLVTSDNGMPFPRSKCSLYDSGVRLPLAISWPNRIPGGRKIEDFVHFADIAPTILQAAGIDVLAEMSGKSLLPLLESDRTGQIDPGRDYAVFGRERHLNHANPGSVYAMRGLRTQQYLLIKNLFPELYPSGQPPHYTNVDRGPTKFAFLLDPDDPEVLRTQGYVLNKRPAIELYDCIDDPHQLVNLADRPEFRQVREELELQLDQELKRTGDPRALGQPVSWAEDPYYSGSGELWVDRQQEEIEKYLQDKQSD